MYIQVELNIGTIAFGVCPIEKGGSDGKTPIQNLILGIVTKINDIGQGLGEREITLTTTDDGSGRFHPSPDIGVTKVLMEYRISEFDFGGVPMVNPWFDPDRIEAEDTKTMGFNPHQHIMFP